MVRGIPVIASLAGGIPEILSPECGILVAPGDENGLARAMIQMAADSALRSQFSRNCIRRSKAFDVRFMLERHLESTPRRHLWRGPFHWIASNLFSHRKRNTARLELIAQIQSESYRGVA